jgi:hypothetical protein
MVFGTRSRWLKYCTSRSEKCFHNLIPEDSVAVPICPLGNHFALTDNHNHIKMADGVWNQVKVQGAK